MFKTDYNQGILYSLPHGLELSQVENVPEVNLNIPLAHYDNQSYETSIKASDLKEFPDKNDLFNAVFNEYEINSNNLSVENLDTALLYWTDYYYNSIRKELHSRLVAIEKDPDEEEAINIVVSVNLKAKETFDMVEKFNDQYFSEISERTNNRLSIIMKIV